MTEPLPEPKGQRRRIPPRKVTAVGLLEPEESGSFPWRLVLLVVIGLLLLVAGVLGFGMK